MLLEQLDIHMQTKNVNTDLTPLTKINTKLVIDLNVKCKSINLLKDNIGENLDNLGFGDNFLDTTPKSQFVNERIDNL